jgi:hypothetical protein
MILHNREAQELQHEVQAVGPQPSLETWSWTERTSASLKTIGTRRESLVQNPSHPPCACRPALTVRLPASNRQPAVTSLADFELLVWTVEVGRHRSGYFWVFPIQ